MPGFGDLGKLVVKIEADAKQLKQGLSEANSGMKNFGNVAGKILKTLATAFVAFSVAAVAAIGKVVQESLKYGEQLDKMNKLTGISAANFAKLTYAVKQEHGSVEALTKVFPILAQRMSDANQGLETYKRGFRLLGVEYKNTNGTLKDVDEVFLEIADSVKHAKSETEALGLVTSLLGGRVAKDLIPFLKQGRSEIESMMKSWEKFGIADKDMNKFAADSKKFGDEMTVLQEQFKVAGIIITAKLLPAFEELAVKMQNVDWPKVADDVANLAEAMLSLFDAIGKVLTVYGQLNSLIGISGFSQIGAQASPLIAQGFQQSVFGSASVPGTATPLSLGTGMFSGGAPQQAQANPQGQGLGGGLGGGVGGATGGDDKDSKAVGGMDQALDSFIKKLTEAQDKWGEFQNAFTDGGAEMADLFQGVVTGMFDTFGESVGGMLVSGQSFTDTMKEGFKSLAQQFIAAIVSMIAKWIAFIAAVMVIAVILQAFGVPIGETFKAAFSFLSGGKPGGLAGKAVGKLGGLLGFREGGAVGDFKPVSARNGLAANQIGVSTGAYGEAGMPAIVHPNEIISPIDKFYDAIRSSQMSGAKITINGYNRDPRELAEMVGMEVDRRRRAP